MACINYDSVYDQLTAFGLVIDGTLVIGEKQKTKFTGYKSNDSKKRGWYSVNEYPTDNPGETVICGRYGASFGAEHEWHKIEINRKSTKISRERMDAIRRDQEEKRRKAEREEAAKHRRCALEAEKQWLKLSPIGSSGYLEEKGIKDPRGGVRYSKDGKLIIPVRDTHGMISGIQVIYDKRNPAHAPEIKKIGGSNKRFWPDGMKKKGNFFVIGSIDEVVAVTEGYATAETAAKAVPWLSVIVAWDANSIGPVIENIKRASPFTKFLILADNDNLQTCKNCKTPIELDGDDTCQECQQPHKCTNAGVEKAKMAAISSDVSFITPIFGNNQARFDRFAAGKGKLTDFNDLYVMEGIDPVRQQINAALDRLGWQTRKPARVVTALGGGERLALYPVNTVSEMIERFACIYGSNGNYFDLKERMIIGDKDLSAIIQSREVRRTWHESRERKVVRLENVGFDPSGLDKNITCNIWGGWPLRPKEGSCDKWLALLSYMCSGEQNSVGLAAWVVKWLAYQLQNPGAKMQTAIVLYGLQGTGKNLLFEYPMRIFGRYGSTIGQHAMEDKFNDWASGKMFIVCNEVVSSAEKYHVKNTLKGLITDRTIRINPKNVSSYEEANHCNLVFLSNERMPVVLEEDDRRHLVIYTPPPRDKAFYDEIVAEMYNGGAEALFHYLLSIDIGDFNEHTKPPMTTAKEELISLSKESIARFADDLAGGEIDGVALMPYLTEDFYDLYRYWCGKQGVKPTPMNHAIDKIGKRQGWQKSRMWYSVSASKDKYRMFLTPPKSIEPVPGTSARVWLGKCVEDFMEQIKNYKGNGRYDD